MLGGVLSSGSPEIPERDPVTGVLATAGVFLGEVLVGTVKDFYNRGARARSLTTTP